MDISIVNLSKNQFHSEDFVMYELINNDFCIMMNSDGNGSIGASSKTDIYQFNSELFELGSTIAITTNFYSKKIFKDIVKNIRDMKDNNFVLKDIYESISNNINDIYNETNNTIYFCTLITIVNFIDNKMYIFNIGDCGYTLINLKTKSIIRNDIQNIKTLAFNGRGTALIACPNSIHNNKIYQKEIVNLKVLNIPEKFVYLQYSDGLDYDIAIPIIELEEKLKKTIDFDIHDFSNCNIVKYFSQLLNEKLKKDKPDIEFSRYNLTKKELKNIATKYNNSKDIITYIIKHIFSIDNKRRKYDDISICVLYYK